MSHPDGAPSQPTEPADAPNRAERRARRKGKRAGTGSAAPRLEPRGRGEDQVLVRRQLSGRRGNR